MKLNHGKMNWKKTLKTTLGVSLVTCPLIAVLTEAVFTAVFIGMFTVLLPTAFTYTYPRYRERKRTREIEKELLPCLYHASSVSSFKNTDEVLETISEGHGELSKEFKKAYREVKTGSSVKEALENLKERSKSDLVKRTAEVLITSHETGSDLSKSLEETAEEVSYFHEMKRKRRVSATIEKYTLLFAGGLIVPLLLGSLISVIGSLNLGALAEMNVGLGTGVKESVKNNSIMGNQVYIGLYSLIASLFVAYQEKEIEKTLVYASVLLPVSLTIFNLARSVNLLTLL